MDTSWSEVSLIPFLKFQATVSFLETSACYPLELLKTRQQAFAGPEWAKKPATFARATLRNFGIRDFFHGFRFAVVGGIPSEVGYYVTYNEVKKRCGDHVWGHLVAGGVAEVSILLLWVPMDVISQRQQLENIKHRYHWWPRSAATRQGPLYHRLWFGTHGHLHAGAESGGLRICQYLQKEWLTRNVSPDVPRSGLQWQLRKTEGFFRPLYRGTTITAFVHVPQSAVYWATYEQSKRLAASLLGETYIGSGAAGFIAGAASAFITNPLDVVKTRYQTTIAPSLMETFNKTARDRRPSDSVFSPFFRGVTFRALSAGPRSAVSFICYEAAMYHSREDHAVGNWNALAMSL